MDVSRHFGKIDEGIVDAISSLGSDQRLQILLALAEAEREQQTQWYRMSFTELYNAVEVDSTSQFSYHLEQLVGTFVADEPDGYHLTYSGNKIVRAILSGVYESPNSFDDTEVPGVCVFCGEATLIATVNNEQFVVRCDSCDSSLLNDYFPRSQARGRTSAEIATSFGYRIWSTYVQLRGSVCPECYGRVDVSVDTHELTDRSLYTLTSTCRECWIAIHLPIEVTAAFHPAAIGFLWDHGISLLDVPLWECFELITSEVLTADVRAVDPFDATFEITVDDETLALTMDDTFTVTPVPKT